MKNLKGKKVKAFYQAWFLSTGTVVEGEVQKTTSYGSADYLDSHIVKLTHIPDEAKDIMDEHGITVGVDVDFYDRDVAFVVREANGQTYDFVN